MKKISIESENRKFGVLIASVIFIVWGLVLPLSNGQSPKLFPLSIGALSLCLALLRPSLLQPARSLWLSFGQFMGRVNSFLLLSFTFYVLITPIALLRKMGKRKPKETGASYLAQVDRANRTFNMERMH